MTLQPGRRLRRALSGLAATLAGVVLLLALVGPWLLGDRIYRGYTDLLGSLRGALPPGAVVADRYDRGWLGATATTELALAPPSPRPAGPGAKGERSPRLRLESRIEQAPLRWLSTLPHPVMARIQTQVAWADTPIPLPPFGVDTDLAADGSALSRLRIPAGEQTSADGRYRTRYGAGSGTIRYQPAGRRLRLELELPSFAVLALAPRDAAPTPASPGGVPPQNPPVLASLGGARLSADLRGWLGAVYAGTLRLDLASAELGPLGPAGTTGQAPGPEARVEGLRLQWTQVPRGTLLDLGLDLEAAKAALGGSVYSNARVGLGAQSLEASALAELIAGLRGLTADTVPPATRGLVGATMLARLLPQLAATGPRIALDPFAMESAEGPISGRLAISLLGTDPRVDLLGPIGWLDALRAEGDIAIPRPVALDWLARAGPGASESPGERLARWSADGWISERDGQLASSLRLARGRLVVNGKRLSLLRTRLPD